MAKKMDFGLPSFEDLMNQDSLFSTQEQRDDAKLERVRNVPIEEIKDFEGHPFRVIQNDDMNKLIESIDDNGMLMPAIVRPHKSGEGYEMVSGHRRKFAMSSLGYTSMDVIIRNLDDEQATILMVDSNIHREDILPSEKGFAYRMKLEAIKHQGRKTSTRVGEKLSVEEIADNNGDSREQVRRYIRITYLIKEIRDMVDGTNEDVPKTMALNPAVEISYLEEDEQGMLYEFIEEHDITPSLSQAQKLKKLSQAGVLTEEVMYDMLLTKKPNQKEKLSLKGEELNKYFPESYSESDKKKIIFELLENWKQKREQAKKNQR